MLFRSIVDAHELTVRPEATASAIDRVELALDCGARKTLSRRVRSRDHRRRSQSAKGESHVPPETTTGGACVCTGGDAGAAGVAALCAETSGGGVARRELVLTRVVVD